MIFNSIKYGLRRAVFLCALTCLFIPSTGYAQEGISKQDGISKQEGVSKQDAFIETAFANDIPVTKTLWLDKRQKKSSKKILGHAYNALRVRYWQEGGKTVWVLNEVGKYKPITVGLVVNEGKIEKLSVLNYRESRGWEVKHDFFTKQFIGAHLSKKNKLAENIDGISGATLSVRALKKLARLSLYFDEQVQNP